MKKHYDIKTLQAPGEAPDDPIALFMQWLSEAEESEPVDPNAMGLSTIDENGRVGSRIVLLKDVSARGFTFYTNRESRKGQALAVHPQAALNFYWKSLNRQVRIEGTVDVISDQESDAYFATRPRGRRIGAWASDQSHPLDTRKALEDKVKAIERDYDGADEIPRPSHWGGYLLTPDYIEFWHNGEFRLHTRLTYSRTDKNAGWEKGMLYP